MCMLASKYNGTIYIGVTNNIVSRTDQHKSNEIESFTKKYNVHRLVYYEDTDNIFDAIAREKQLKNWHRPWKIALIERDNPKWQDLSQQF